MKVYYKLIGILFIAFIAVNTTYCAHSANMRSHSTKLDTLNIIAKFSLFYEDFRVKSYESAYEHGWDIIYRDPTQFLKYKVFEKMEETIWYLHDSTDRSEVEKMVLADTVIHLYETAIAYEPLKKGYFTIKKAFVLETWKEADPESVIPIYKEGLSLDPKIPSYYKDRLGLLYLKLKDEKPEYEMEGIELYGKLAMEDPNNPLWPQRQELFASDPEELRNIKETMWLQDKNNVEKAWEYATFCAKNQFYKEALVPFEFLVAKYPEVINYWTQLASVYNNLKEFDKAIKAYKKLIDLQPNNRDNYYNIALVYKDMEQLSVARSYAYKASNLSPDWIMPYLLEAQLYEQAARSCEFDFMAKCVYQLAVNTYRKAASMQGPQALQAADRIKDLSNALPNQEDYFFRKYKSGDVIKIEGSCYDWIRKTIIVP